jgi:AraC-like DNA-binding protein
MSSVMLGKSPTDCQRRFKYYTSTAPKRHLNRTETGETLKNDSNAAKRKPASHRVVGRVEQYFSRVRIHENLKNVKKRTERTTKKIFEHNVSVQQLRYGIAE